MGPSVLSSPLGHKTDYVSSYDPGLLFPILRQTSREILGITSALPFFGCDIWTGYELSWLNPSGMPQVAAAEFIFPCDSHFIIESKSFKLYLNSFNQTVFNSYADVTECLKRDLSLVAGAAVNVNLQQLHESLLLINQVVMGVCLDGLDITVNNYHPDPTLLTNDVNEVELEEELYSHLLKTNCPVTGQPDWASLFISYSGKKINHENLLRYIISFREHQDFHEHCVERVFVDILNRCKPESLSVYARYTRRGGLDINPFRSTREGERPSVGRLLRQ
ncbi:MAG: NADPH-dependent 7-cyano-7-deazaguanine reductase QueF [Pseudomonadota bacterium]